MFDSNTGSGILPELKKKLDDSVSFSSIDNNNSASKCKANVSFLTDTTDKFDLSKLQEKSAEISGLVEKFEIFQSKLNTEKESYGKLLQSLAQKYDEQVKDLVRKKFQ